MQGRTSHFFTVPPQLLEQYCISLTVVQGQGADNWQTGQGTSRDKGAGGVDEWTVPKGEIGRVECVGSHSRVTFIRYNRWFHKQHGQDLYGSGLPHGTPHQL